MRRPSRLGRGILAITGFAVAGCGALAGPAPWKTVAASGQVEAHPPAITEVAWRAVARGDLLDPQTTVRTGHRGRATLAGSGSILIVDRDSRVDLPDVVPEGGSASVTQTQGRVVYKIEKAASKHFEVVTPYLVAGVKGTTFMVTVKDHTASVTVREGTVEVASAMTGEKFDVHAGETVVLGNDSQSRMELVSAQPAGDARRAQKSEIAERARAESSRMAGLLDGDVAAGDTMGAKDRRDLGVAEGLDALADGVKGEGGAVGEATLDPLRDPIDSLPSDSRSAPGAEVIDPINTVPKVPGPGTSGPGGGGPGSSTPSRDATDSPTGRLPSPPTRS